MVPETYLDGTLGVGGPNAAGGVDDTELVSFSLKLLELEVLEVLESMDIVPMESGETEPSPTEEVELGFPDGTVEVPEDVADDENDDEDVVDDSVGEGVTIGELGELPALGV